MLDAVVLASIASTRAGPSPRLPGYDASDRNPVECQITTDTHCRQQLTCDAAGAAIQIVPCVTAPVLARTHSVAFDRDVALQWIIGLVGPFPLFLEIARPVDVPSADQGKLSRGVVELG